MVRWFVQYGDAFCGAKLTQSPNAEAPLGTPFRKRRDRRRKVERRGFEIDCPPRNAGRDIDVSGRFRERRRGEKFDFGLKDIVDCASDVCVGEVHKGVATQQKVSRWKRIDAQVDYTKI